MTIAEGGEPGQTVTGLWAKFEANTTDPAIVLARMGAVPSQSEPCGRPTRRGTLCPQSRNAQSVRHGDLVFLSPACGTHLTDDERAHRQAVLDAREEAGRAANAVATPKCWAWPVDDAVRTTAASTDEDMAWGTTSVDLPGPVNYRTRPRRRGGAR